MLSLKSRKRDTSKSQVNTLLEQKQLVFGTMIEYICVAVFLFFAGMLVLIVNASTFSLGVIVVEIFISLIFVYFLALYIRSFLLFRKLSEITLETEELITLYCSKVSFIHKPISRFLTKVLCIVFNDENGNKLYFVYPKTKMPYDIAKKKIREQYYNKRVQLVCYKNTNIVKSLLTGYLFTIKRNVFMYNHVLIVTNGEKRYEAIIESAPMENNTMLIWLKDFGFPKEDIDTIKVEMAKWFSAQNEKCIFYPGKRC